MRITDDNGLAAEVRGNNVREVAFEAELWQQATNSTLKSIHVHGQQRIDAKTGTIQLLPQASNRTRRYGPMYSILNTDETIAFVVGTTGTAAEAEALFDAARRLAFSALQFGQLDVRIVNDVDFDFATPHHVVLFGSVWHNDAVRGLAKDWPTPGKPVFQSLVMQAHE